ncbi:MAG: outer membrane porin, OprD family [Methyloprofundus sp.]|nr:outer membrane porin, OprD family [Methyloprofundus sp.]
MKTYLYSLLIVLLTLQISIADEKTSFQTPTLEDLAPGSPYNINNPKRETGIKHDLKYDGCNGFVRAGYIQTHKHTVAKQQAYGFGGELGCGISWGSFFKVHASTFTAINPGFNSGNKDEVHTDFFNENKKSYITLGEAVMTLSYADFEAHIGPQRFDSPHMDQDDLRLLPNIFEAYLVDYVINKALYAGAGFVRTAKGWENNHNQADFVGIGKAFGGEGSQSWVGWGAFEQENVAASIWYYYIKDVQQIVYADLHYRNNVNNIFFYELGTQFDLGRSVGKQSIGNVDATTLGFMASLSAYGVTFSTAFNKNWGKSAAVNSVGGGPFYTSMEEMTLDAVDTGINSQAVLLNLEYQPIAGLAFGVATGDFQAEKARNFHTQELNAYLSFQYANRFNIEIMYALIKNLGTDIKTEQIRVLFGYQF